MLRLFSMSTTSHSLTVICQKRIKALARRANLVIKIPLRSERRRMYERSAVAKCRGAVAIIYRSRARPGKVIVITSRAVADYLSIIDDRSHAFRDAKGGHEPNKILTTRSFLFPPSSFSSIQQQIRFPIFILASARFIVARRYCGNKFRFAHTRPPLLYIISFDRMQHAPANAYISLSVRIERRGRGNTSPFDVNKYPTFLARARCGAPSPAPFSFPQYFLPISQRVMRLRMHRTSNY